MQRPYLARSTAALAAILAAFTTLSTTPAPTPTSCPQASCGVGGGIRLLAEPVDTGQGLTRITLAATTELDVAFLDVEVLLPDGGRLRSADLPEASATPRGARLEGRATVARPVGTPILAIVRGTYGLAQPDGSVEVQAEELLLELGGEVPVVGLRTVRTGAELTLDVPAVHVPAGGER